MAATRATLLLCACLLAAGSAAAKTADGPTACGKMSDAWKPVESVPKEISWAVYKGAFDRYGASGLAVDWDPWYCEEPTYSYQGCYANSTDNTRTNYMLYLNATCTPATGGPYTLGITADASWYNSTAYAYDVDLEYVWGGEDTWSRDDLRGVWWEKNDDYWYDEVMDEVMDDMMDDKPPSGGY